MEEKERYYSLIDHNGNFTLRDYETGNELTNLFDLDDLLNQQDKRIKELQEENLSLQEQSIRDNQNWIEETTQLKQQLHDLPKKIVGEIKKELYDCGKTYLEDEPYIEICIVQGILDTILKKYGGKE